MSQRICLIYTDHAIDQMRDRGISKTEVEACWDDHHTEYTDRDGNPNYIADVSGRRIKVVVKRQNHRVVITAAD